MIRAKLLSIVLVLLTALTSFGQNKYKLTIMERRNAASFQEYSIKNNDEVSYTFQETYSRVRIFKLNVSGAAARIYKMKVTFYDKSDVSIGSWEEEIPRGTNLADIWAGSNEPKVINEAAYVVLESQILALNKEKQGFKCRINLKEGFSSFKRLKLHGRPTVDEVRETLILTKLLPICEKNGFDILETDIMFLKPSYLKFEDYKNQKLKDGSDRTYIELFPEESLKEFHSEARRIIEAKYSKK